MLGGYPPSVVATDPGRPPVSATDGAYGPFGDPGPAANVAPGNSGALSLTTTRSCPAGQSAPRPSQMFGHIVVTLPGGGQKTLTGNFDVVCGVGTSRFGVVQPRPVYTPEWYAGLTASVAVANTVAAGSTLTFVVTLANPTTHVAHINPCPGYIEHLWGHNVNDVTGHGLNCNTLHQIPASGRIRYEMRLAVPKSAQTGNGTLQWAISGPDAPVAQVAVRVSGSPSLR